MAAPRRSLTRALAPALALVIASALAPHLLAVEQTGEIAGTIVDETGQPLPGVVVALSGPSLQGERAQTSNVNGEFAFRSLPPGPGYTLKFQLGGYLTIESHDLVVQIGRTTRLPVQMKPGELSESVTVEAKAPPVDVVHTNTQDNYGRDYLETVPVGSGGRDYLSVIQNSAGTGPGDGANPTVRGSTIGQNVYLVDGVDSTDPVTNTFGTNFVFDAIEEVQFQTGGFPAEFGRSTGGIVNIVTKSGGNDFSGSVDLRFRNQNFIENGDHFDSNAVQIERKTMEATLGGPIVKDKLWFFAAGSLIGSDNGSGGNPTVSHFDGKYYLGKLTWQATPDHKFILQATGDPATIDNADSSPLVALEATSRQKQGSNFISAQYQGVLDPTLLVQAQLSYYKSNLDFTPQRGDLTTIGFVDFDSGLQTRNAVDVQTSDRKRNQLNATFTWIPEALESKHTFKAGWDLQDLSFSFEQFPPGGEYDQVIDIAGTPTPLIYNATERVGTVENTGFVVGYFAQDEWRVTPRITLNPGLRYERYSYDDDTGRRVIHAELLEPRFGASWDITGNARNVVKAAYGLFADPSLLALPRVLNSRANATDIFVNEEIADVLVSGTPGPFDYNGDGVVEPRAFLGTFGGPGGSTVANGGALDAARVRELSASYERALGAVSAVSATLVDRKTSDIIEDAQDPISGVYIIDNIPELARKYYGLELRYKTTIRQVFLQASYTWSKSKGNIEYTQSLGADYDFPELTVNRYGYLTDDTRHTIKLNGSWSLPLAFRFAWDYAWVSGYPYDVLQAVAPYGDAFVEPRGSRRMASRQNLNVDLRKRFAIGKSTLEGILSVINVFDSESVVEVSERVDTAGLALTYAQPRRYELGARWAF